MEERILNVAKTTFMVSKSGLTKTVYIHRAEDLTMAVNELFNSLPADEGLRIQIRRLKYEKDSHCRELLKRDKKVEKENEEMGDKVPEVPESDKAVEAEQDKVDSSSET